MALSVVKHATALIPGISQTNRVGSATDVPEFNVIAVQINRLNVEIHPFL